MSGFCLRSFISMKHPWMTDIKLSTTYNICQPHIEQYIYDEIF